MAEQELAKEIALGEPWVSLLTKSFEAVTKHEQMANHLGAIYRANYYEAIARSGIDLSKYEAIDLGGGNHKFVLKEVKQEDTPSGGEPEA